MTTVPPVLSFHQEPRSLSIATLRATRVSTLLVLVVASVGCQETIAAEDAAEVETGTDAEADAAVDAESFADGIGDEPDADWMPRPGALTQVSTRIEALQDRLCDLDGDGIGDNTFADIGSPHAELFLQLISVGLAAAIEDGDVVMIHIPWVEDLAGPRDEETTVIFGEGEDVDIPYDPTDNFSGEEPFYIGNTGVDSCGEPRFFDERASIEAGTLTAGPLVFPFTLGGEVPLYTQELAGRMAPAGASGSYTLCGHVALHDIGDNMVNDGEFSLLEAFVAGGDVAGVTSLPGIDLDLDLDGDGLERLILADDNHITACADGDSTVIDGADCWRDERMADGYSINIQLDTVSAVLQGLQPNWRDVVGGTCDDPPERSLWDPPESR